MIHNEIINALSTSKVLKKTNEQCKQYLSSFLSFCCQSFCLFLQTNLSTNFLETYLEIEVTIGGVSRGYALFTQYSQNVC